MHSDPEMMDSEPQMDELTEDQEAALADDPMDALIAERDGLQEQLMRALAEFQNFRRRATQEKDDVRRYATENLVRGLIPVLDNFERTLAAAETGASFETLIEGVRMVDRQLRAALAEVNVQRIPAVGVAFDPTYHEAIATDEDSEAEPGTVTAELEPGYRMGDRVVRPARVRVRK